ncbi:MAG TPA: D-glycerate dehydrogenase [Solirubrobacteraceae bacterium]|nr:D-glycerate dehydrogenase [Solirubrobacteraceae bacterium]
MARCFATRRLPGPALGRIAAEHDLAVWSERLPPPRQALLESARHADGLLCLLTDNIDAELITACPRLRVISNYAVGWDNVDVAAAAASGIAVGHTPDVLTETTADLAFALILAARRRLLQARDAVAAGDWLTWEPDAYLGDDVHGATLGIVGPGRIGRAVARRAAGFDMTVIETGRASATPLPELLARADIVSLHCPLTPETYRLIDQAALKLMRPTAVLVNTARGPIVDQAALRTALCEGWIAGAALDVTDPEPLPPDDPLFQAPNLLVLPHIGSATHAARERMANVAADNLLAGLAGEPLPHAVPAPPPSPP